MKTTEFKILNVIPAQVTEDGEVIMGPCATLALKALAAVERVTKRQFNIQVPA